MKSSNQKIENSSFLSGKGFPVSKIDKEKNLAELVAEYPNTVEVLLDYGLHCVGCIASSFDTIEAGSKVHGLSDKEIDEMVERLNEVINFAE